MGDLIYLNEAVRQRQLSAGLPGLRQWLLREQGRTEGKRFKVVTGLATQIVEKTLDNVSESWWGIVDPQVTTCAVDRNAQVCFRTRVSEIERGQRGDYFLTVRRLSWDCSVEFPQCIPAIEINKLIANTADLAQMPRGGLRPMLEKVGCVIEASGLTAHKIRYDLSRLYIEAFDKTDPWGPEASSYEIVIDFSVLLEDIGTICRTVSVKQG